MSPLPMTLRDPLVAAGGGLSAIIAPRRPIGVGAAPEPFYVKQTIGAPVESLRTLGNPSVPAFRSRSGFTIVGGSLQASIAPPAGLVDNDLVFLGIAFSGAPSNLNVPPGFTLVKQLSNDYVYVKALRSDLGQSARFEPALYTVSWTNSMACSLVCIAYSSADGVDDAVATTEPDNVIHTSGILSCSANVGLLMLVRSTNSNLNQDNAAGWTERFDFSTSGGANNLGWEGQDLLAAGGEGTRGPYQYQGAAGFDSLNRTFLIAIAPAAQAGIATIPSEYLQSVKQSTNAAVDAGGQAVQTAGEPIESLGGIRQTLGAPIESVQKLAISGGVPTEWLSVVLSPGSVSPYEWLAGIRQTAGEPIESLGGIRQSGGLPVESLALLAASGLVAWESLATIVAQTAGEPIESLQGIRTLLSSPIESEGGVRALGSLPIESLSLVLRSAGLPSEWLAKVAAAVTGVPVESLQGITKTNVEPYESLRLLSVTIAAPVESLAPVRALASAPYEWRDLNVFLMVSATAGIFIESTQGIVKTANLPIDAQTGLPGIRLRLSESVRSGLTMVEYVEEKDPPIETLKMSELRSGLSMSEIGPVA